MTTAPPSTPTPAPSPTPTPAPSPAPSPTLDPGPELTDVLVALRVVDRVVLRDVRRLARFAEGLAAGTVPVGERRALAVADWTERVCDEIRHRHDGEDHAALRGLLGEVRRGTRGVVAALLVRPTVLATAEDFARIRALADRLNDLAALLDEHTRTSPGAPQGPPTTRHRAARALFATAPDRGFTAARARAAAGVEEVAAVTAVVGGAGPFARRALRRRERLVFGVRLRRM